MKLPGVKTPQFRTLLIRRLKNVFPDCTVQIEDARIGITFQLFDGEGRAKTDRVNIYRAHATALTKGTLVRQVQAASL